MTIHAVFVQVGRYFNIGQRILNYADINNLTNTYVFNNCVQAS